MKKLPVDVSNFQFMIENDYLYIDKTRIIYELITKRRLYFLSRPRRFGKSLLITTLKELFSGNKKLFENTWIGKHSNYTWPEHPVIHLDFSQLDNDTSAELKSSLSRKLDKIAEIDRIDLSEDKSPGFKIQTLVEKLSSKNKVVILIDEYDYPLLAHLRQVNIAQANLKVLKDFFTVIKSLDAFGYMHAIFITGVTKIARTSIFSGMNNLNDLSLSPEAATLLGYTHDELIGNFKEYAQTFAKEKGYISTDQVFSDLESWYDGYRFSESNIKVYNPFSVVHTFDKFKIANYWLESGTPGFLIELLKQQYPSLQEIENSELSSELLGTFEISELPIIPILFQTGYLTIADYDEKTKAYKLQFPNIEVKESFTKYLVASLTQSTAYKVETAITQLKKALTENNIDLFCVTLKSLLANIPYQLHIENESYYHSLLQFLLDLLGFGGQSEISTSKGRIDLTLETQARIYIFEFKFKSTGKKALEQIKKQKYYEKYMRHKKPISLVGLSFNMKKKELNLDWASKEI